MLRQQLLDFHPTPLAFAGAIADAGHGGHLGKAGGTVFNGLDQADQFDPLADTAGLESGHHSFIGFHGWASCY
jgi:hypothetical protein